MTTSADELESLLSSKEDERLECKEARDSYGFDDLAKYCAALSNEGSGKFILGVTDKIPRKVVGSNAFQNLEQTVHRLVECLRIKVRAEVILHPSGRVVVFDVPSRPPGIPIVYKAQYLMRAGESLVAMTPDMLKAIVYEGVSDYSAQECVGATIDNLDSVAIEEFRRLWIQKSGNKGLSNYSTSELLESSELISDGKITIAALALLGSEKALARYLAPAEIVFEYRPTEASGAAQQRTDFRKGYFLVHNELWYLINLRNDIQHFHDGLFVRDIRTFNEIAVREAIQNAVAHRDYRLPGSIFVRQYPQRIEIVSPGGLPDGITLENILTRQAPRNRRIAETLQRCGMVERSGYGINLMFEQCIKESKPSPDFEGTDDYQVSVALSGLVRDPRFISFLEKIGQETLASFATEEFIILDSLNGDRTVPEKLHDRMPRLVNLGVVERMGRGRGTRYILSRRYYDSVGKKGTYTRKRGLDRGANLQLLLNHIRRNKKAGSAMSEFKDVLPHLTVDQIKSLLRELKIDGLVSCSGRAKSARWFPTNGRESN